MIMIILLIAQRERVRENVHIVQVKLQDSKGFCAAIRKEQATFNMITRSLISHDLYAGHMVLQCPVVLHRMHKCRQINRFDDDDGKTGPGFGLLQQAADEGHSRQEGNMLRKVKVERRRISRSEDLKSEKMGFDRKLPSLKTDRRLSCVWRLSSNPNSEQLSRTDFLCFLTRKDPNPPKRPFNG